MIKCELGKRFTIMKCDKNPQKIRQMFDEISVYYDGMNNFISFGTHFLIKILSVADLKILPDSQVLDLCCGTGDFTKIISKIQPAAKVIGLDFSKKMIQLAMAKNRGKTFIQGDCMNLPFKDCEFDYVTMGFGLRNIQDRQGALGEVLRVLKSGGKFLHLDFGMHNKISKIFNFIVPVIAKILRKNSEHYKYLLNSKETFPNTDDLIREFETAGFRLISRHDFLFGTISAQIMEK